jgi:hypothetical protein
MAIALVSSILTLAHQHWMLYSNSNFLPIAKNPRLPAATAKVNQARQSAWHATSRATVAGQAGD